MEYALRLSEWVRSRKCENNLKMYTIKRSGNLVYQRVDVKFTKIRNVKIGSGTNEKITVKTL